MDCVQPKTARPGFIRKCAFRIAGTALAILVVLGIDPAAGLRAQNTSGANPLPAHAETIVRMARADLASLPRDFVSPEGRTRWDLRDLKLQARFVRTLTTDAGRVVRHDEGTGERDLAWTDPSGGDAAVRLGRPDLVRFDLRPGMRLQYVVDEGISARLGQQPAGRLLLTSTIAGIGWAHLPSGPREVVLERLLVQRAAPGSRDFVPERLIHRFIDPNVGVVAEISGPPTADGRGRAAIDAASLTDVVLAGAADLRLYVHDLWSLPYSDLLYSRDRAALDSATCTGKGSPLACCRGQHEGTCTQVSVFSAAPVTTIGDLINLPSWDFTPVTTGVEVGATTAPMNAQETCNIAQCGYTETGAVLDRTDRAFDDPPNLDKINNSLVLENRASDSVIWMRSGSQHEGRSGSFGSGESRFCYTTFGGVTRSPAPLWLMAHQDAPGAERYMLPGDAWASTPLNCEQDLFNQICGQSQFLDKLYAKACSGTTGAHAGTQSGAAMKNGVVTLPTGHTFNAMLAKNVADFCVYTSSGCNALFKVDEVRTVNYLWQVPWIGTVARLQSEQNAADLTSWPTVQEGLVAYGPFPPVTIQVTGVTDTSVSLSWNPGNDTHRTTGYKVYWDSDSGAGSAYAFNSAANPGQAAVTGTTAVISGLTPGTAYYFTVTSLATFTDPSSGTVTNYESLLYPTQVSGDPSFVYPVEVTATTTGGVCIPGTEVEGLTVDYAAGGGVNICWNAVSDPCLQGYRVLGANTPEAAANFSTVADTGVGTCWTGTTSSRFFLVVARGTGGNGPWGHYGQ
jgi:hypothetical protein